MTIRIPQGVAIAGGVLFGLLSLAAAVKEAPEIWRYLKVEGM
jgi:hypothetical protein